MFSSLLMSSLREELIEAFDEYWEEHEGDYDHPEIKYQEFMMYLPVELKLLRLEYQRVYNQAKISMGDVSLLEIEILIPNDTIIATFKSNQP